MRSFFFPKRFLINSIVRKMENCVRPFPIQFPHFTQFQLKIVYEQNDEIDHFDHLDLHEHFYTHRWLMILLYFTMGSSLTNIYINLYVSNVE